MIYVSYSSLRDYFSCKRKLYYRITKAPRPTTASLIVGTIIHEMVSDYMVSNEFAGVELYIRRLMDELGGGDVKFYYGQTPISLAALLRTCFDNYILLNNEFPPMLISESNFEFAYSDGVRVVGKFDQLREDNLILEFKTGKKPPTGDSLRFDLQSTMYIWAYREVYGEIPTFNYVHLPTGQVYEIERTFDDFIELVTNIDSYIYDRLNEQYLVKQPDMYKCANCDYVANCFGDTKPAELVLKRCVIQQKKQGGKSKFDV